MMELYYISQGENTQEHLQNIEKVCTFDWTDYGFLKYVQLRLKNISEEDYLRFGEKAKSICKTFGTTLIINDHVEVAKHLGVGLHVGKEDVSVKEARKHLREAQIIGATANTLEDCLNHIENKADYIGLGPFRYTETKKNLSPVLGLDGVRTIMEKLQENNIQIPVYVIGGITEKDFKELEENNITKVAVSTAMTKIAKQ